MISMVNSDCKFEHDERGVIFNEELDKEKFIPDGITIAYVKSNFCELYHKDYEHLNKNKTRDPILEQFTLSSNIGRKRINKQKKKSKKNNGSNKEFASSIAFGLIHDGNVYEMRVFRKSSIGISGLTSNDNEFIKLILNKLIAYLNSVDPILNIRIKGEPNITLCNVIYHENLGISLIGGRTKAFNLYLLMKMMRKQYSDPDIWSFGDGQEVAVLLTYNGETAYYTMNIKHNTTKYLIKFYSVGKINIYGGKNNDLCGILMKKFTQILECNKYYLVQDSIPTRNSREIEYEY